MDEENNDQVNGGNGGNVNTEPNMAASYAETVKQPPSLEYKDNASEKDDNLSSVKPVFILENDLFGNIKPQPKDFLTHQELYKTIDNAVKGSHIKGLQRVGDLWRIYLDNEDDRNLLITKGLVIRKKTIGVYTRNPYVTAKEDPYYFQIRIRNVPISADDGQIMRFIEYNCNLKVHNYHRERLRIDGYLTNCQTGDRIFHCDKPTGNIPRYVKIGKYSALLMFKGQIVVNRYTQSQKCFKCLETGHKQQQCPNDWTCKQCLKSGHKASECTAEFDNGDKTQDEENEEDENNDEGNQETSDEDPVEDLENEDKDIPESKSENEEDVEDVNNVQNSEEDDLSQSILQSSASVKKNKNNVSNSSVNLEKTENVNSDNNRNENKKRKVQKGPLDKYVEQTGTVNTPNRKNQNVLLLHQQTNYINVKVFAVKHNKTLNNSL